MLSTTERYKCYVQIVTTINLNLFTLNYPLKSNLDYMVRFRENIYGQLQH